MNINGITYERHEEVLSKYVDIIRNLKMELKKERQVVDFYAAEQVYVNEKDFAFGLMGSPIEIDKGHYARTQKLLRKENLV